MRLLRASIMRRTPNCDICRIIRDPANDDVTIADDMAIADHWRIALMSRGLPGSMYITAREHRRDID